MYGLVNNSLKEMLTKTYDEQIWLRVLRRSGLKDTFFITTEPYDDSITFKLAIAASEELNIPISSLMFSFGEFWVMDTAKKKYAALFDSNGMDIKDFFLNLPMLHSRIALILPKLRPPEFVVTNVEEFGLYLHYYSHRTGLTDFIFGLISGIGKVFNKETTAQIIGSREKGDDHETFQISWN
jgi:hypothetical protein